MAQKRILNIGCGNSFEGTDRIDFMKTPSTTKVCDIENGLPYEKDTFDEIICYRLLEHLRNLKTFIDECFRVLKNGGKICLQTDNAGFIIYHIKNDHNLYVENYKKQFYTKENQPSSSEDHHYHLFVPSHLKYLFQMARFQEIKISYVQVQQNRIKRLFLNLLPFNIGKEEIKVEAIK